MTLLGQRVSCQAARSAVPGVLRVPTVRPGSAGASQLLEAWADIATASTPAVPVEHVTSTVRSRPFSAEPSPHANALTMRGSLTNGGSSGAQTPRQGPRPMARRPFSRGFVPFDEAAAAESARSTHRPPIRPATPDPQAMWPAVPGAIASGLADNAAVAENEQRPLNGPATSVLRPSSASSALGGPTDSVPAAAAVISRIEELFPYASKRRKAQFNLATVPPHGAKIYFETTYQREFIRNYHRHGHSEGRAVPNTKHRRNWPTCL
mmetsp:Transcript_111867/g.316036  ORF Transcript_111867/g.316036 Transcript_111867/m.316036 type:complete len:265 (+) Transcript_111867:154-948(+)